MPPAPAAVSVGAAGGWVGCVPGALALACVALGMVAMPAAGQEGGQAAPLSQTIEEAIFLALKSSRAAIGARLGRDEQKLSLEAAEERYLPRASLGATMSDGKNRDRTTGLSIGPSLRVPTGGTFRLSWSRPVEGPGEHVSSTSLTFTQPLLKGFGPAVDMVPLRRARMQERINVGAFRDRVASVVGSVIGAYRGVLRAGRRLAIARQALERARRQLEINRALVEAGRMAPQDLVQTEASVANREYALTDSEDALEAANASLVNILDLEEGARIEPEEEPAVRRERPDLEKSQETAFARRTDWLRAKLGVEFARSNLRVAENGMLPDLSLRASTSHRDGDSGETDYSLGLNLTVPLWDYNPRRSLVRARNGVQRAKMALAESRQSIRLQVRRAVRSVAVALRRIDLSRQARDLAARKLEIERLKLQQGLSSSFQLERFENDLVNAQRRELDAVVGYRNALDSLDRTLGTTLDRWGISVEQVGR